MECGEGLHAVSRRRLRDRADGSGQLALQTDGPAHLYRRPIRTLAEAADSVLAWLSQVTVHGRDLLAGVDATVHRIDAWR